MIANSIGNLKIKARATRSKKIRKRVKKILPVTFPVRLFMIVAIDPV